MRPEVNVVSRQDAKHERALLLRHSRDGLDDHLGRIAFGHRLVSHACRGRRRVHSRAADHIGKPLQGFRALPRRAWQRKAWGHKASRRSPSERRAWLHRAWLRNPSAHRTRRRRVSRRNRPWPDRPWQRQQVHRRELRLPSNRQRSPWSGRPSRRAWKRAWISSWVRPPLQYRTRKTSPFILPRPVDRRSQAGWSGQRSEGRSSCAHDWAEPAIDAEGPTPSCHNSAKGSDRLHGALVFFVPLRGAASFGRATRRATRPRPARRGVRFAGQTQQSGCWTRECGAVRPPQTRLDLQSQRRVRYEKCDWSSSRSP